MKEITPELVRSIMKKYKISLDELAAHLRGSKQSINLSRQHTCQLLTGSGYFLWDNYKDQMPNAIKSVLLKRDYPPEVSDAVINDVKKMMGE